MGGWASKCFVRTKLSEPVSTSMIVPLGGRSVLFVNRAQPLHDASKLQKVLRVIQWYIFIHSLFWNFNRSTFRLESSTSFIISLVTWLPIVLLTKGWLQSRRGWLRLVGKSVAAMEAEGNFALLMTGWLQWKRGWFRRIHDRAAAMKAWGTSFSWWKGGCNKSVDDFVSLMIGRCNEGVGDIVLLMTGWL